MPKMKTHRGAAKRVMKTGTGLFKRFKAGKSHILTKKTAKRKRHLKTATLISKQEQHKYRMLLPYV